MKTTQEIVKAAERLFTKVDGTGVVLPSVEADIKFH
jgi:hypothetical protein